MVSKTAARRTLTVVGPAVNPAMKSSGARKIPTAKVVFARMGHASVPPALTASRMGERLMWTAVIPSALDARLAPGVIGAETASLVHVQRVSAKLCYLSARTASKMVKRPTWTAVVTGALPVLKVQPVRGASTVPAVCVQEGCVPRRAAGMVSKTAARRTLTVAAPAVNPAMKSSGARKITTAKVVFARMAHASVPPALTRSRMMKRPTWTAVVTGALDARLAPGVIGTETASLVHVQRVSAKLCDFSARTASRIIGRQMWTAVVTSALDARLAPGAIGAETASLVHVQRVSAKLCYLSARMASRMVKRPTWTAVVTGALLVLKTQPVSGTWTVPAVCVQEGYVPRRAAEMVSKTAARRTLTVAGPAVNPAMKSSGAWKIPTAVALARMGHASVPPALTASRMG